MLAGEKYPYWFTMRDEGPFSLAAIYNPEGFSLITTEPNELVETVHNRMPVILPKEAYRAWLDPATEESDLKELLSAFPANEMKTHPVSKRVNKVAVNKVLIDDPSCIAKVREEKGLF